MKRRVFICPVRRAALTRQGLTTEQIAAKIGCTASGVSRAQIMHDLPRRPRGRRHGADYPKRTIAEQPR